VSNAGWISEAKAAEIEQLCRFGYTHAKVAALTGTSKTTIKRVLSGRWREDYERRKANQARRRQRDNEALAHGPFVRCRGCGGRVQLPCRVCRLRAKLNQPAGSN
jgi:IS30 family transposase